MNKNEIERKFFVREMPDLSGIKPFLYERYILEKTPERETRITKINNLYIKEVKTKSSELGRITESNEISESEFNELKKKSIGSLRRDKYVMPGDPEIHLQIYHDGFEGLMRAEVEFESEAEAKAYVPEKWMGKEITGLPIARDAQLIGLSKKRF